jgi:anthranilate phosphoribosyltransferase
LITEAIHKLMARTDLTETEARQAMQELMAGEATDAQIGAFLTALRMKGETPAELVGFVCAMRERAEPFWDGAVLDVLDTCGTGGDQSGTFNISTAAAFVVAGAGIRVAKHGNRSRTGCGSAEVIEALGIDIQMPLDRLRQAVSDIGVGFLFAPRFHSSMKHVGPARMQLKMQTVFNIIGPLANPARPRYQVIGVFSQGVMGLMAHALNGLTTEHAFVVHGNDGMDEISISAPTKVMELNRGDIREYTISPEDFGVSAVSVESIRGGDAAENAATIEALFRGERGPKRDVVLMNAAAAIVAGGAAQSLREGFRLAVHSVDSGAAAMKLANLRELSKRGS